MKVESYEVRYQYQITKRPHQHQHQTPNIHPSLDPSIHSSIDTYLTETNYGLNRLHELILSYHLTLPNRPRYMYIHTEYLT